MAFYLRYYNMFKKVNKGLLGLALTMGITSVHAAEPKHVDVLLIGGGIMSATLGVWLNELEPGMSMEMIERLDGVALESSNGWNNAGTGHSALAELNYTPEDKNGNVEIPKAIEINEAFQVSRQFWSWQVKNGVLKDPRSFINSTPHMSFVWGDDNIKFLKKRYEALQASPLFAGMEYSEDPVQIKKWVPLMMEGRDPAQKVAATWSPIGTDVNFGEITRQFTAYLQTKPNFSLKLSSEVEDIKRNEDGSWRVVYKNLKDGTKTETDAKFVFIGAGGGALHLLQKSGIPEAKEYAGFPVGGSFLVTENPTVAQQHLAKAYGKASVGAPPMSVPHLDTRVLDGKRVILFGPFANTSVASGSISKIDVDANGNFVRLTPAATAPSSALNGAPVYANDSTLTPADTTDMTRRCSHRLHYRSAAKPGVRLTILLPGQGISAGMLPAQLQESPLPDNTALVLGGGLGAGNDVPKDDRYVPDKPPAVMALFNH